jgi:hypothetical protein
VTRSELSGWSIPVSVGIVSLVVALTLPAAQIQWSGWVYFSMIILVPLHDFFHKRELKAVQDGSQDGGPGKGSELRSQVMKGQKTKSEFVR